ncbi:uncharacterized protein LOC116294810 [Actinia tenebrosa]|uniref:Uncharacterized protein LOC116294810 n=1 Tax=Actinia tenebrosa TaxID=6105 RepID=A0A6P8I083_ACTTE|nr:uncharacterized protein LOC116294810 [Actinia tenebrosa]
MMISPRFCSAFFHVPEIRFGTQDICRKHCLHPSCIIGQQKNPKSQPRTVDALVVIKSGTTEIESFMYTNQPGLSTTKHAEEFFYEDVKCGRLSNTLYVWRSVYECLEICMYITYQPCHFSTRKTPGKSCSSQMVKLYEDVLKPMNIKFVIKPTLIYKAYWNPSTANFKTRQEILQAKDGIRKLFAAGIDIQAMEEKDWIFLRNTLCQTSRILYNPYEGSEREKLDAFIRQEIIFELMNCVQDADQEAKVILSLAQKNIETMVARKQTFHTSRRIRALSYGRSHLQQLKIETLKHLETLRYYFFLMRSSLHYMQLRTRIHDCRSNRMLQRIHYNQKNMLKHLQLVHDGKEKILNLMNEIRSKT